MWARLSLMDAGPGMKALIISSSSGVPMAGSQVRASPRLAWQTEKPSIKALAELVRDMPAI